MLPIHLAIIKTPYVLTHKQRLRDPYIIRCSKSNPADVKGFRSPGFQIICHLCVCVSCPNKSYKIGKVAKIWHNKLQKKRAGPTGSSI